MPNTTDRNGDALVGEILDVIDRSDSQRYKTAVALAEHFRGKYISKEQHEIEIVKAERYARANEHHIISNLLSNEDLAALSPGTVRLLKRRKNELTS